MRVNSYRKPFRQRQTLKNDPGISLIHYQYFTYIHVALALLYVHTSTIWYRPDVVKFCPFKNLIFFIAFFLFRSLLSPQFNAITTTNILLHLRTMGSQISSTTLATSRRSKKTRVLTTARDCTPEATNRYDDHDTHKR